MTNNLNKLNCMNYMVDNGCEHYYLLDGIRSLYKFSKARNVPFKALCLELLDKGYLVLNDRITQIAMI